MQGGQAPRLAIVGKERNADDGLSRPSPVACTYILLFILAITCDETEGLVKERSFDMLFMSRRLLGMDIFLLGLGPCPPVFDSMSPSSRDEASSNGFSDTTGRMKPEWPLSTSSPASGGKQAGLVMDLELVTRTTLRGLHGVRTS